MAGVSSDMGGSDDVGGCVMAGRLMAAFWAIFGLLLACMFIPPAARAAEPQNLRISTWSGANAAGINDYFFDLVKQVLIETEPDFGTIHIVSVPEKFSQGRLLAELSAGRIDLVWTATSQDRERNFRPIRIPIDMGLIGQRVPVIRADRVAEFAGIKTVDDLRKYKACQGAHWPDADIVAASGLPQEINTHIDQLYTMLRAGRCDYFARGVAEVAGEVAVFGGNDLIIFDQLVVAYPMPMYVFVAKDNDRLAQRLEHGLRAMATRGAIREMMARHASTRAAFPLDRFKNAVVLRLPNPTLPTATPLNDPSLWLDVGDPRRTFAGPS